MTIEKLQSRGGKLWEKHDKHRLYFGGKALALILGFDFVRGSDKEIYEASIEGMDIDIDYAKSIWNGLDNVKFYFDLDSKEFYWNSDHPLFDKIVDRLEGFKE